MNPCIYPRQANEEAHAKQGCPMAAFPRQKMQPNSKGQGRMNAGKRGVSLMGNQIVDFTVPGKGAGPEPDPPDKMGSNRAYND